MLQSALAEFPVRKKCNLDFTVVRSPDRVKEQVMARLDVEPELSDVVEVCQAWEDGLVVL